MTSESVRAAVDQVLCPGCFFVAEGYALRIEHVALEETPWEVFRGHLLDPAYARSRARFASWHVYLDGAERATVPLISLRYQAEPARVFVTRQILTHAFEAYEDAPGVILTRPVQKWVAELIGTIELTDLSRDLAEELSTYVLLSVIGTSRLPITSLESPLPAFSLGQLAYLPRLAETDRTWTDPLATYLRASLASETVRCSIVAKPWKPRCARRPLMPYLPLSTCSPPRPIAPRCFARCSMAPPCRPTQASSSGSWPSWSKVQQMLPARRSTRSVTCCVTFAAT